MNTEGDEYDDGDYGMGPSRKVYYPVTKEELRVREYFRKKKDQEDKVSYDFNRYLIDIYNEARKKSK